MRLDTYAAGGQHLEAVGAANSNTIFAALQQVPGGPQATVLGPAGNIIRVVSPNKSPVYPNLGDYVRSLSGKAITLHTAFFGKPFVASTYSGTFAADGSIVLAGTTNPPGQAPATIPIAGANLIGDIYTGGGTTANDLESAIYRDLLAGFSAGFWDGRYGNDALSFCSNPTTNAEGIFCPEGFNQPAFGDARLSLSPFPTCEQYAAVINQYSDVYGNPYSDAAKRVTVGLNQPISGKGGQVDTLRLTIQPDSGNAQPVAAGNPNCGAAAPVAPAAAPAARTAQARVKVRVRFLKRAKPRGKFVKVGRLACSAPCGQIQAVAKKGKVVIARKKGMLKKAHGPLKLRLTKKGKRLLKRKGSLKVKVAVRVRPAGQKAVRRVHAVKLVR
jgi:hypothetical protein